MINRTPRHSVAMGHPLIQGTMISSDSWPSETAGVPGTRCKHNRARTRHSCRAGGRPGGWLSERPQGAGPFIVGPGETEHLIRGKAKIT
jgi:Methyltransferase domain